MSMNLKNLTSMKRGQGLTRSAQPKRLKPELIRQDEGTPAVPEKAPPRQYRLSTKINDNAGDILEEMRNIIRKQTGRRPLIAEVIEVALEALEKEMTGGHDE